MKQQRLQLLVVAAAVVKLSQSIVFLLIIDLPKIYTFASEREKEIMLNRNFKRVNEEVERMVNELLGKG